MRSSRRAVFLLLLSSGIACGRSSTHRVLEPPRLSLAPYPSVGLVTFTMEKAKGNLSEFATRRFEEMMLAAQTGYEVREFPRADSAQVLGGDNGVPVAFFGHLTISDVKPKGGLASLLQPHIEATISAELSVWLVSTKTGGTLWRASSRTTEQVGELAIVGGIPYLSATNPNDTYGPMVNKLVRAVTWDLRSTWVDQ